MLINDLRFTTVFMLIIGMIFLIGGISLYLSNGGDSMPEKVGLILFTCGALFVGIGYTVFVAWRQEIEKQNNM